MPVSEPVSRDEFHHQMRDCLVHLYDFAFLQHHPLVQALLPDLSGAHRVQMFREMVTEAIDSLRPPMDIDFHDKQARFYNILVLRYVERQQAQEVIQQLALSDRQFYREHPKAIEALSSILWERLTGTDTPTGEPLAAVAVSVESEVRRLQSPAEQNHLLLEGLLEGAIDAVHDLATEHQVEIHLHRSDETTLIPANRTVLRQVVLLLLTQLTVHLETATRLEVHSEIHDDEYRVRFTASQVRHPQTLQKLLEQQVALQHLVKTLGGKLVMASVPQFQLMLQVPLQRPVILLVDDNPDILDLFQRYSTHQPYLIRAAQNGDMAIQFARTRQPNLIILDILLPGQDGFEILQNLKNHHSTRHIPVLVCSVLEMADLTRSLGADAYLKKPPGQADFLTALAQWLE